MGASERLNTTRRRKRVLELRDRGWTYQRIAERLVQEFGEEKLPNGWDSRYAYKDLNRTLKAEREALRESAREMLDLELRRLDALHASFFPRALTRRAEDGTVIDPDPESARIVLNVQKRRAKLVGLDKPEKLDLGDTVIKIVKGNLMDQL